MLSRSGRNLKGAIMDIRKHMLTDEMRRIDIEKGDGEAYIRMLEEKYNSMTDEEKAEVDAIGRELDEMFGMDDDE